MATTGRPRGRPRKNPPPVARPVVPPPPTMETPSMDETPETVAAATDEYAQRAAEAQEASETVRGMSPAPSVAESQNAAMMRRIEELERTVVPLSQRPQVVAAPNKAEAMRDEIVRAALMSDEAFGSDELGAVSSSRTYGTHDPTAYCNLDGSSPAAEDEILKWVSLTDDADKESDVNVHRELQRGAKIARDPLGNKILSLGCMLMRIKAKDSALMLAADLRSKTNQQRDQAVALDGAERERSSRRGIRSGGMHRRENDDKDPFAPQAGTVLIP